MQSVGADEIKQVDVRIIAATNRDLAAEIEMGRFRADLYHRLNAFEIALPPLRDRVDDVALLAGHFLDVSASKLGMGPMRLSPGTMDLLQCHDWPGNVRELEHGIMRGVLRAKRVPHGASVVEPSHLKDAQILVQPAQVTPQYKIRQRMVPGRALKASLSSSPWAPSMSITT